MLPVMCDGRMTCNCGIHVLSWAGLDVGSVRERVSVCVCVCNRGAHSIAGEASAQSFRFRLWSRITLHGSSASDILSAAV